MENNETNSGILAMNNDLWAEEEITFKELGKRCGIEDLDTPEIYDIAEEGYEVLSFDHETGQEVWKTLEAFVVKKNAAEHYQLNTLHGTADHRVFFNGQYVRLADHPGAELVKEPIQVVDCQVADTHNYIAEGQINHNTTTPGGSAIPYASSVRLRVMTGQPIKAEKDRIIGINVEVKCIKNKVAKPFRSAELSIIFGKGVVDDEQTFDVLRAHCDAKGPVKINGKRLLMEGAGGWKTFSVTDDATGEVLHEVKFNKSDFRAKVLSVPEYQGYIADLLDAAMIMGNDDHSHASFKGADSNSLEEMRKQENE
jgi:hypothetical protein